MPDNATAGATPVVAGAPPAQSTPAQPATGTQDGPAAATADYPDGLGDAGKRAIDAMKAAKRAAEDRAAAAERERDALRAATQTDTERAIAQAKREGAAEVATRLHAAIRRSEVRAALSAAGVAPGMLDLATRADEFTDLKVTDDGTVDGLAAAIEAFRKGTPDLFRPPTRPTTFDGGPQGGPARVANDMNAAIRRAARGA